MTPYRLTNIAIDFDRTFTSDIEFWRLFITRAVSRGHKVFCVTGRTESSSNWREVAQLFGEAVFKQLAGCVFCDHSSKRARMQALGYKIDIWIDDMPEGIGTSAHASEFKKLEDQFDVCETLPVFNKNAVDPQAIWQPPKKLLFTKMPSVPLN